MRAKALGLFPDGSGIFPGASGHFPEGFAFVPEGSGRFPEGVAFFPEAFGFFPEGSAVRPEASAFFPKAFAFVAPCCARNMGTRPPPHPNARRIASPAVRAKILAAIGRKLQPAERDDVMQKTYMRLFAIIDRLPESDEELIGLVGVVTHGQVIDQLRRNTVRDGRQADESEAPDVEEPEEAVTPEKSVEWKALFDIAEQAAREGLIPPESLGWAERLARGDTYEQIGLDEGLPAATVRKRMERVRKILRSRWTQVTGLTGAVIGAILLFFYLRKPATPDIVPEAYVPAPSVSSAPAVETTEQKLARLTSQAQLLCDQHNYLDCETILDVAKEVDSTNEDRPPVIKMRHAIQDASKKPQRLKP